MPSPSFKGHCKSKEQKQDARNASLTDVSGQGFLLLDLAASPWLISPIGLPSASSSSIVRASQMSLHSGRVKDEDTPTSLSGLEQEL